jgi:hypothetical protein
MARTKNTIRRLSLKVAALATLTAVGLGAISVDTASAALPRTPHYQTQWSRGPGHGWNNGYSGYDRSQAYRDVILQKLRGNAVRIYRDGQYQRFPSIYTPRHRHGGY